MILNRCLFCVGFVQQARSNSVALCSFCIDIALPARPNSGPIWMQRFRSILPYKSPFSFRFKTERRSFSQQKGSPNGMVSILPNWPSMVRYPFCVGFALWAPRSSEPRMRIVERMPEKYNNAQSVQESFKTLGGLKQTAHCSYVCV